MVVAKTASVIEQIYHKTKHDSRLFVETISQFCGITIPTARVYYSTLNVLHDQSNNGVRALVMRDVVADRGRTAFTELLEKLSSKYGVPITTIRTCVNVAKMVSTDRFQQYHSGIVLPDIPVNSTKVVCVKPKSATKPAVIERVGGKKRARINRIRTLFDRLDPVYSRDQVVEMMAKEMNWSRRTALNEYYLCANNTYQV